MKSRLFSVALIALSLIGVRTGSAAILDVPPIGAIGGASGTCTSAAPLTSFNFELPGSNIYSIASFETDDSGTGVDYIIWVLVDGEGTVLDVNNYPATGPQSSTVNGLTVQYTPASGLFSIIVDDTTTAAVPALGAKYTPENALQTVQFDAHALNPNCPSASPTATTDLAGAMLELRGKLILEHGPDVQRRLNRLKGIYTNNGGVSGFGLAYRNDNMPFAVTLGTESAAFGYSLRNSRLKGGKQDLSGKVGSVATGLPGAPAEYGYVYGNTSALAYSGPLSAADKHAFGMDNSLSPATAFAPSGSKPDHSASADGVALPAIFGDGKGNASDSADPMNQRYDVWVEGQYTKFNATAGDGTFAILHAGADYLVTEDLLVGLGTQFDWIDMDAASANGTADGWGFMIGPYMTAKIVEGLYLDARGAWGRSYNHVSPDGTYEDPFDGTRWLATAALIGDFKAGDFTISPEARLSYFREKSEAFVDSLLVPIPSVTTETGTFTFGPTISRKIAMENDTVFTPFTTVSGIWTFSQKNTAAALSSQPVLEEEGIRAKVEAGFDIRNDNGLSVSISGHYDGLGDSGFEAYGGMAKISKAF